MLALVERENVNLDDILDAGKHLTKLRLLFYEVHTGNNVCMVGNTRFAENCANCEILDYTFMIIFLALTMFITQIWMIEKICNWPGTTKFRWT